MPHAAHHSTSLQASDIRKVVATFGNAPPSHERMRWLLETARPDVRYLVAHVVGRSTGPIARVCASVLAAAAARTGILEGEGRLPEGPIDDALYDGAGRLVISAAHQLGIARPDLGEAVRREIDVALALIAFAEAGLRVALLVEEGPPADLALTAVHADLVVLGETGTAEVERAFALVRDGSPVVSAPQDPATQRRIEDLATERAVPLLLGGRDFSFETGAATCDVTVAGEQYAELPIPDGVLPWQLATGIGAALGIAALGIRMREEWVHAGVAAMGASDR